VDLKVPEFKIHNLWPIPVYENNFEVDSKWLNYVKDITYERVESDNGDISVDRNLLDNNILNGLKEKINYHIDLYTKKYLNVKGFNVSPDLKDKVSFYLQESWCIKHKPHDYSHSHYHKGSLVSGVYYVKVPNNSGHLVFQKTSSYVNIFPSAINIEYNDEDLKTIDVKEGDIYLFPSHLMHKVNKNLSDDDRYCISFDCFVKGE